MMKAIVCRQYGGFENLAFESMPEPTPAAGSIRIRVESIGVNFPDALLVRGLYQAKPDTPFIPGIECAGIVDAVGENVAPFQVGQRVVAMSPEFGSYAELVAVPASHAYPIPESLDINTAGALLCAHGTAYHALKQRASLKAGETLLVTGAAGGTGLAAVQLGHAFGARVIAVCSSAKKCQTAKQHGADTVIDTSKEDLRDAIRHHTNGLGADVIFDPVGGEMATTLSRSVAWNGRWLVIGFAAGGIPEVPLNLPLVKGYSVVGVFWGNFCAREPDLARANHQSLFEMAASGRISPHIHGIMPLADATRALEMIEGREVHGKVLLKPSPD